VIGLVPCHVHPPERELLVRLLAHVGGLLVVDDGMPAAGARELDRLAGDLGARVLRLPANAGKGHALAAGIRHLLDGTRPPAAVLMVDADGQHDPALAPRFLAAAADAELVIGDRFGDLAAMPPVRRAANWITSRILGAAIGAPMRDTQCGMRLLRGRALRDVAFPPGGYEAETRHLKDCVRAGVAVAWVPIPAVYQGQPSSFRPLVDSARVLIAALG
jgi:glycosyltransferase involved in cell wall biosynthesis